MKILRQGLVLILILIILLFILVACTTTHSIVFQNDACIKPMTLRGYDYLTCDKMRVLIDGETYVVPKNFKTDLASVPRALWSFIAPQYTGFVPPAILHDYLYSCANLGTRKWSDEVFYSALMATGVSRYTAMKFYLSVRLFGKSHFNHGTNYCPRVVYE